MLYVSGKLVLIIGAALALESCTVKINDLRSLPLDESAADTTGPDSPLGLGWSESTPRISASVTAAWTKSVSGDLANQKIQFYSDSSCTTASGALIDLASNSAQTYAWTAPTLDGTYSYMLTSLDTAGNSTVSACSSAMVINPCVGLDALVPFARGDGSVGSPYGICSKEQMNRVGSNATYLDKYFILLADVDLATYTANSFTLIGTSVAPFIGTFDGNGKVISNLTYSAAGTDYIGLFRAIGTNGVVKNLGVESATITGAVYTGILAGETRGAIDNCHATGSVTGTTRVGGLAGRFWETNAASIIEDSYATGNVTGTEFVGGLVGWVRGTVRNSYSTTGTVTSSGARAGGLIAIVDQGTVVDSYANKTVAAAGILVGGLVGGMGGTITHSYSLGSVTGTDYVGGLTGWNTLNGATGTGLIEKSYSLSAVNARDAVGGITGYSDPGCTISDSYFRGTIAAREWVGGITGWTDATITNSYVASTSITATITTWDGDLGGLAAGSSAAVTNSFWDVSISGIIVSGHDNIYDGVGGATTTTMKTATTYTGAGWSSAIWDIVDGSYPTLK